MAQVNVYVDEKVLERIDRLRGGVSRAAWVRGLIEDRTGGEVDEWREALERRVSRLEEMAGL